MPAATGGRLLKLADREFRQITEKPSPPSTRKFKPIRLNLTRFDASWDRKRGAAVRLMGVVLREDDAALERRVCESDKTAKTYADAASWLQRESAYLRKVARLLDTAEGRLVAVLTRCSNAAGSESQAWTRSFASSGADRDYLSLYARMVVGSASADPAPTSIDQLTALRLAGRPCRTRDGSRRSSSDSRSTISAFVHQLQIGMGFRQVMDIAGQPTDHGAYITGKAFIPFYYGSGRSRSELVYKGQGRLVFDGGSIGNFSGGNLVWIIHCATEPGYR